MSYPRMRVLVLVAACAVRAPAQAQWERVPDFPTTPGSLVSGFQPGNHRMVWDPVRQRVMLVNGFGDVWEWDGRWANVHTAGFPPSLVSIAYDTARQRTLLYSEGLTWEWDGTSWTQRFPATSPPFRRGERLVYDAARSRVVLFGGRNAQGTPLGDTWEWDGGTWVQRLPAIAPPARFDHALAYDSARGRVVLFGGARSTSLTLDDTWAWDGSAWTQLFSKAAPSPRSGHDLAYDAARQRVVLFGGPFARDTWEWDGSGWTLRGSTTRPPASSAPALAYHHARQRIVMWSGLGQTWEWNGNDWSPTTHAPRFLTFPIAPAFVHEAHAGRSLLLDRTQHWEWDGTQWTQRVVAPVPGRSKHAMAYDAVREKAVVYGGTGGAAETWEWDGTSWLRRTVSSFTFALYDHAMAYDASRERVVRFGGYRPRHGLPLLWSDDTLEWDGTAWQTRTPATSPSPRGQTAIAYDAARRRIVLFGGAATSAVAGTGLGDTWEWDGTTWTQRTPAVSPPPRLDHTMAYDRLRGRVVLFGGSHRGTHRSDTWEWDGTSWLRRSAAIAPFWPAGSDRPVATYDETRQRIVMFDGISTWEYYTSSPAAYAPFGEGCAGPAGVPLLGAAPGSLPWAESSFRVQLAPIVPGQPAVLFFGVSSTSWSGIPLPLALGVLGRPDCSVLASLDLAVPLASAAGAATLTIPLAPTLVGGVFYNQGASLDLTSGPAGLAFSNGARAEVGAR